MPSFNYVSGNPSNLTPGGAANMADIQGPFTDLRSAINGQLDETNVPNLAAAFTTYKRLATTRTELLAAGGGVWATGMGSAGSNAAFATGNAAASNLVLDLDPTIFNANSRTTKLNLRMTLITATTLPGNISFIAGLYPVATYGQTPAFQPRVETLGTVISGSTATVTNPSPANSRLTATSGDFNFPAAGAYVIAISTGAMAASSGVAIIVNLDMRQV